MRFSATLQGGKLAFSDPDQVAAHLAKLNARNAFIDVEFHPTNQRSQEQNRALHLYLTNLAEELNKKGYDYRDVIHVPIEWNLINCKNEIWRKTQIALTGKQSTKQLLTHEVGEVYDVINKLISERTGIYVPFPSLENYE
jgi:hypothetical protein